MSEQNLKQLADLLRDAAKYLKIAEGREDITLDMSVFSKPSYADPSMCRMCLAGCYMVLGRGLPKDWTEWSRADTDLASVIDCMRVGEFDHAYTMMFHQQAPNFPRISIATSIVEDELDSDNGIDYASVDAYFNAADALEGLI